MSEFYGRTQGKAGEATRTGSKASGIASTVETWHAVINASMRTSEYTASGYMSEVHYQGKFGGTALSIMLDADSLYEASDDYRVRQALKRVRRELNRLDDAAQAAVERRRAS